MKKTESLQGRLRKLVVAVSFLMVIILLASLAM